ncbi:MAG TPA: hypothetical protein VK029_03490 [Pseudogracilibacillus sp.]|nr:hypothetical protein [Pseudogracilibacillus sp.]
MEQEKLKQVLKKLRNKIEAKEIISTEQAIAFATKELKDTGLFVKTKKAQLELIRE